MINNVRGWLRGQARRPRDGAAATFAERVRKLKHATPAHVETELRLIEIAGILYALWRDGTTYSAH